MYVYVCVSVCVLVGFLSSKKGTDQEKKIIEMNKRERERDGTERGGGGGGKRRRKQSWLFRALAHPTDVDHIEDIRRKEKKKLFPSLLIVQRQERVGKNLLSSLTSVSFCFY